MTTEYGDEISQSDAYVEEKTYSFRISFLYNGQLGVITDDNGLYYMRSRYYNPEIKRFINQDILTGNIGNSASLNRYSYVEGNPISYSDPFGLEPFSYFTSKINPSVIIHTTFDILGCLPGGSIFDVANAAMYAAEGNYKEAAKCLIFAIPGMDLAGKGAKYIASGSKVGKVVGSTLNVVDKTGKVLAITVSAYDFGNQAAYMIDKYMVNGEPVSWETVYETLILCSTGFQVTQFTKMAIEPVNTSHVSENAPEYGVVEDSAIENIAYDKSNVTYDDYPGGERIDACSPKGGAKSGIGCFTAGTKVKTSDGEKNIEDIEVGDEVYAYDVQTGETGVKKVVRTYIHDAEKLVYVTVDGETIEATTNHPFYVEGYGFRQAEDLKPGYILILLDGSRKYVEDIHIEELSEAIKVYNFEVEDWHTYFVGEQGVLVHNNCGETIPEGGSGTGYTVSDSRKIHILEGDGVGNPGHGPNRGFTQGAFPDTWTDEQAISAIEDVANNPNSTWKQATGAGYKNSIITRGSPDINAPKYTSTGRAVRYTVRGQNHGLNIEVIVEPNGEGIITGYSKGH